MWGGVGDGDVVSGLAWGGEPGIDHNHISMVFSNNEVWQGLCEEHCHDHWQMSQGRAQGQSILIDS